MGLENKLKKIFYGSALGFSLAYGTMYCGPDHPNGNNDGGVCCDDAGTGDTGMPDTASDGAPDAGSDMGQDASEDAGSDSAGDGSDDASSDAPGDTGDDTGQDAGEDASADVPCTTTPIIDFKSTPTFTYDTTASVYKGTTNTAYELNFCDSQNADRYKVDVNDGINLATILDGTNCTVSHTFPTAKDYQLLVTAWENECNTNATQTYTLRIEQPNTPPIAMAGPDMTIQKNKTYCFNFSNNNINLALRCGSTTLALGHTQQGTGSYDPDGNIVSYKIFPETDEDPTFWREAFDGKILMSYSSTGARKLTLEVTDNNNAKTSDEAIIMVSQ